ncbi:hypothetical protein FOL47_001960 [Perkinsus chesapeaki]|uniref:RING-type domain-containing protein n=1 Tax=Perkinsus chesapeaki TaxID=330153 RepID=A0A7J6N178_PERCH|nr:hypothetical protein FOL47_001960 [Perkinsus chesapeaki]
MPGWSQVGKKKRSLDQMPKRRQIHPPRVVGREDNIFADLDDDASDRAHGCSSGGEWCSENERIAARKKEMLVNGQIVSVDSGGVSIQRLAVETTRIGNKKMRKKIEREWKRQNKTLKMENANTDTLISFLIGLLPPLREFDQPDASSAVLDSWTNDEIDDLLECKICYALRPVFKQLPCPHRYCADCVAQMEQKPSAAGSLEVDSICCPECRVWSDIGLITYDVKTLQKLLERNARCSHYQHGCTWRGPLCHRPFHACAFEEWAEGLQQQQQQSAGGSSGSKSVAYEFPGEEQRPQERPQRPTVAAPKTVSVAANSTANIVTTPSLAKAAAAAGGRATKMRLVPPTRPKSMPGGKAAAVPIMAMPHTWQQLTKKQRAQMKAAAPKATVNLGAKASGPNGIRSNAKATVPKANLSSSSSGKATVPNVTFTRQQAGAPQAAVGGGKAPKYINRSVRHEETVVAQSSGAGGAGASAPVVTRKAVMAAAAAAAEHHQAVGLSITRPPTMSDSPIVERPSESATRALRQNGRIERRVTFEPAQTKATSSPQAVSAAVFQRSTINNRHGLTADNRVPSHPASSAAAMSSRLSQSPRQTRASPAQDSPEVRMSYHNSHRSPDYLHRNNDHPVGYDSSSLSSSRMESLNGGGATSPVKRTSNSDRPVKPPHPLELRSPRDQEPDLTRGEHAPEPEKPPSGVNGKHLRELDKPPKPATGPPPFANKNSETPGMHVAHAAAKRNLAESPRTPTPSRATEVAEKPVDVSDHDSASDPRIPERKAQQTPVRPSKPRYRPAFMRVLTIRGIVEVVVPRSPLSPGSTCPECLHSAVASILRDNNQAENAEARDEDAHSSDALENDVDPETRKKWDDLFDLFDIDKSNSLDAFELGSLIRSLGEHPFDTITQPMLTDLMRQVQTSKERAPPSACTDAGIDRQYSDLGGHITPPCTEVDRAQFHHLMHLIKMVKPTSSRGGSIAEDTDLFADTDHAFDDLKKVLSKLARERDVLGDPSGRMKGWDSKFLHACKQWEDYILGTTVTPRQRALGELKDFTLKMLGVYEDEKWVRHQRHVTRQCIYELNRQVSKLKKLKDILSDFKTDLSWFTRNMKMKSVKGSERAEIIMDEQIRIKGDISTLERHKSNTREKIQAIDREMQKTCHDRQQWQVATAAEAKEAEEKTKAAEYDIERAERYLAAFIAELYEIDIKCADSRVRGPTITEIEKQIESLRENNAELRRQVYGACQFLEESWIPTLSTAFDRIRAEGRATEEMITDVIDLEKTIHCDATTDVATAFPYTKVQRPVFGQTMSIDSGIGFSTRQRVDFTANLYGGVERALRSHDFRA